MPLDESSGCLWAILNSILQIFLNLWPKWPFGAAADEDTSFRAWMILLVVLLFAMLAAGWWWNLGK